MATALKTTYVYDVTMRRALKPRYSHAMLELYLEKEDGALINKLKPEILREVELMPGEEPLETKVWKICCTGSAQALELEKIYVAATQSTSISAEVRNWTDGRVWIRIAHKRVCILRWFGG